MPPRKNLTASHSHTVPLHNPRKRKLADIVAVPVVSSSPLGQTDSRGKRRKLNDVSLKKVASTQSLSDQKSDATIQLQKQMSSRLGQSNSSASNGSSMALSSLKIARSGSRSTAAKDPVSSLSKLEEQKTLKKSEQKEETKGGVSKPYPNMTKSFTPKLFTKHAGNKCATLTNYVEVTIQELHSLV